MQFPRQFSRPDGSVPGFILTASLLVAACGLHEHTRGPIDPVSQGGNGGSATGGTSGTGGSPAVGGTGGSPIPGTGGATGTGGAAPSGGTGGNVVDAASAPAPRLDGAASTPAPTVGVTINGTFVPKDKAIVFVHFGHSNMAGKAQAPNTLRPYFFTAAPNLWSYQGAGRFVAAVEPTAPDPPTNLGAGPGMAWLRAAQTAAGPDYHFISIARGHGSSPTIDFVKGGLYYSTFMDRAIELKGKVTFGGVFVMLGITERHMPLADQAGLPDRMAQIIANIRADLGEPNLPVLHTDYEVTATGTLSVTSAVGMKLRPLVLMLPTRIPNLAIIPTDGVPLIDDHHFDMTGQKMWADRGIQIMIERGWFPWKKP